MNIEDQIRQLDFHDPEQVISFYESNRLYFDNYQFFENAEKISGFLDIKMHYAKSLFDKVHYDKVYRILDEVSDLLAKLPKDHWNYEKSEKQLRFLKGMTLANQKKFKESYPIFKTLLKEDPEHFYYKLWYDHTKLGTYNWVFSGLSAVGAVFIFSNLLFSLDEVLPFDLGIIGLVFVGLSYLTQKGLNEYLKKKKTAPNNR